MSQQDFEFETWEAIAAVKKPEKRPLTQDELIAIDCLSGVRLLPGSWEKRFNRDVLQLARTMAVPALSEKAIAQLWRLLIRYRRQWRLPALERERLLRWAADHSAPDYRKVNAAAREQKQIDELKEKYERSLQRD